VIPHPRLADTYGLFTDGTHSIEENEVVLECTNGILIHYDSENRVVTPLCYSYPKAGYLATIGATTASLSIPPLLCANNWTYSINRRNC